MSEIRIFTAKNGQRIGIPLRKITGITEPANKAKGNCFIATNEDDEGSGWYVEQSFDKVKAKLDFAYQLADALKN